MKLLCEQCSRVAPPAGVRVEGGAVVVRCGCGAEARWPASVIAAAEAAAPAWRAGGALELEAERPVAAPARVAAPPPEEPLELDDWLSEAWSELRASAWTDPAAHERIVSRALASGDLAELGRLYRRAMDAEPNDKHAQLGRDLLLQRAQAQLMAELPAQEAGFGPKQASSLRAVLMLLVIAALAGVAIWLVSSGLLRTLVGR